MGGSLRYQATTSNATSAPSLYEVLRGQNPSLESLTSLQLSMTPTQGILKRKTKRTSNPRCCPRWPQFICSLQLLFSAPATKPVLASTKRYPHDRQKPSARANQERLLTTTDQCKQDSDVVNGIYAKGYCKKKENQEPLLRLR